MTEPAILSVHGVSRSFGGLAAVQGISLSLRRGIITALVGPNGAGKTTLFNLITGHLSIDSGDIQLNGASIVGKKPYEIARMGVARSFQDLCLFGHMTVRDNVLAAVEPASWLWQPGGRAARSARLARVEQCLTATGIEKLADARAVDLSYAEAKFLSVARIMATGSSIWLLDEPASGLDPASRTRFVKLLKTEAAAGVTICLIEHNLEIVTELGDRIAFLDQGRKLAEGEPEEVLRNPELIAIYFGERPK